jgi:hypothetical protein
MTEDRPKAATRLSIEQRAELAQLADLIALRQAEINEMAASFKLRIAKLLIELGQPVGSTALCLMCGSPHPSGQPCLVCSQG